jgi:ankyrin repeat protein
MKKRKSKSPGRSARIKKRDKDKEKVERGASVESIVTFDRHKEQSVWRELAAKDDIKSLEQALKLCKSKSTRSLRHLAERILIAKTGQRLLHVAAAFNSLKVLTFLRRIVGVDLLSRDARGMSAFHWAAQENAVDALRLLLEMAGSGAQSAMLLDTLMDFEGNVPLRLAVWRNCLDVCRFFVAARCCSIDNRWADGSTALLDAARHGHFEVARVLVDAGATLMRGDALNRSPLYLAAEHGRPMLVALLLAVAADRGQRGQLVDWRTRRGRTALMAACHVGCADSARALLDAGAPLDVVDCDGAGAVHMAASNRDSLQCLATLLSRQAASRRNSAVDDDDDDGDDDGAQLLQMCATAAGDLPLHLAIAANSVGAVRALLDAADGDCAERMLSAKCSADDLAALHLAALIGHETTLRAVAARCPLRVGGGGECPLTLLIAASADAADDKDGARDVVELTRVLIEAYGAECVCDRALSLASRSDDSIVLLELLVGARAASKATTVHHTHIAAAGDVALEHGLYVATHADARDAMRAWLDADVPLPVDETLGASTSMHAFDALSALASGQCDWLEALRQLAAGGQLRVALALADARRMQPIADAAAVARLACLAAARDDVDALRTLVDQHGATGTSCSGSWTPLHLAASVDTLNYLLAAAAAPEPLAVVAAGDLQCTPLHCAAWRADVAALNALIGHRWSSAEGSPSLWAADAQGATALHYLASVRSADESAVRACADLLLASDECADLVDAANERGETALHRACAPGGSLSLAQMLVFNRANIDAKTRSGWTALHLAVASGHVQKVSALLVNNARINEQTADTGDTALHLAIANGHFRVAELLLAHYGANGPAAALAASAGTGGGGDSTCDALSLTIDVERRNIAQRSPLHVACTMPEAASLAHFLVVEARASPSVHDADANTPLHLAVERGHRATATSLLSLDVDVDCKGARGHTALHIAAERGDVGLLAMLLGAGATLCVDLELRTPLHGAALSGSVECLSLLLARSNASAVADVDDRGQTPLHVLCASAPDSPELPQCAALLVARMRDRIDALDSVAARSALHYAAERGLAHVCSVLVHSGGAKLADSLSSLSLASDGATAHVLSNLSSPPLSRVPSSPVSPAAQSVHRTVSEPRSESSVSASTPASSLSSASFAEKSSAASSSPVSAAARGVFQALMSPRTSSTDSVEGSLSRQKQLHACVAKGNSESLARFLKKHGRLSSHDINSVVPATLVGSAQQSPPADALDRGEASAGAVGDEREGEAAAAAQTSPRGHDDKELSPRRRAHTHSSAPPLSAGDTALHSCVAARNFACCAVLAQHALCNVDMRNTKKLTALHCAALGGRIECARLLLEAGADVNARNERKKTPVLMAAAAGDVRVVRQLAAHGADLAAFDSSGKAALQLAALACNAPMLAALIGAHSPLQPRRNVAGVDVNSALHVAIKMGSAECVRMLCDAGADVNWLGNMGRSPLHAAAGGNHVDLLSVLLGAGAALECRDDEGATPLLTACRHGARHAMLVLAEHGAELGAMDARGRGAVHMSVDAEAVDLVIALCQAGVDVDLADGESVRPLHLALQNGDELLAIELLESGATLDAVSDRGLHLAARSGCVKLVQLMLRSGDAGEATLASGTLDADGHAPLYYALLEHHDEVSAILLGVDSGTLETMRDRVGRTPLSEVCRRGWRDCAELLIDARRHSPNAPDLDGGTAVHASAAAGQLSCLELCLANGGDANRVAPLSGQTPLLAAIEAVVAADGAAAADAIVRRLIVAKADVNLANANTGVRPLHAAAARGARALARLLLDHRADVNAADAGGRTPLLVALEAGQRDMCRLLMSTAVGAASSAAASSTVSASSVAVADSLLLIDSVRADNEGHTPLHRAIESGDFAFASLLLATGASANALRADGLSPMHLVAAATAARGSDNGSDNSSSSSNNNNTNNNNNNNNDDDDDDESRNSGGIEFDALFAVLSDQMPASLSSSSASSVSPGGTPRVARNSVQMIELLADEGALINERSECSGLVPLHCVAAGGDRRAFDALLARGALPSMRTVDGVTALHLAAAGGHASCCERLLELDADGALLMSTDECGDTPLHRAAAAGQLAAAIALVRAGAEVNVTNAARVSPLHMACRSGVTDLAALLLENGADVDALDERSSTPLHVAASSATCTLLLEKRAELSAVDADGQQPLHVAAAKSDSAHVALLVESGAALDCVTRDSNRTPLHLAVAAGNCSSAVMLLKKGANRGARDEPLRRSPLHLAALHDRADLIAVLLGGVGVDGDASSSPLLWRDADERTPLHLAALNNNVAALEALLAACGAAESQLADVIEAIDARRYTALHCAAAAVGSSPAIRLLARAGANLTATAAPSRHLHGCCATPLHVAAAAGHIEAIHLLVYYRIALDLQAPCVRLDGAGDNDDEADTRGYTAMLLAAANGHVEALRLVLLLGADASSRCWRGHTALHAAAHGGQPSLGCVELLLELRADDRLARRRDARGRTPLHVAARVGNCDAIARLVNAWPAALAEVDTRGRQPIELAAASRRYEAVELLLKLDGTRRNVAHRDRIGLTPLHYAALTGSAAAVRALLVALDARDDCAALASARDNDNACTPLHYALASGSSAALGELLKWQPALVAAKTGDGRTAAHLAAARGSADSLAMVIDTGCALDERDGAGWTPLGAAVMANETECVRVLLNAAVAATSTANADDGLSSSSSSSSSLVSVNGTCRGEQGANTLLHVATHRANADCVAALLDAGADPTVPNKLGETPLHVAAARGLVDIASLLLERWPRPNARQRKRERRSNSAMETAAAAAAASVAADRLLPSPLFYAVEARHADVVRVLLRVPEAPACNPNVIDDESAELPLHRAMRSADQATLDVLLECAQTCASKLGTRGMSALHLAVALGGAERLPLVEALAERCADALDVRTSPSGHTALHIASQLHRDPMVDALTRLGADASITRPAQPFDTSLAQGEAPSSSSSSRRTASASSKSKKKSSKKKSKKSKPTKRSRAASSSSSRASKTSKRSLNK